MTPHARPRTRHDELFDLYVPTLDRVVREAANSTPQLNAGGPLATHPRIIAVFREFFLACDRINREDAGDSYEYPQEFTIGRLKGKRDDLADVLAEFPYLPIGVDEHDNWA